MKISFYALQGSLNGPEKIVPKYVRNDDNVTWQEHKMYVNVLGYIELRQISRNIFCFREWQTIYMCVNLFLRAFQLNYFFSGGYWPPLLLLFKLFMLLGFPNNFFLFKTISITSLMDIMPKASHKSISIQIERRTKNSKINSYFPAGDFKSSQTDIPSKIGKVLSRKIHAQNRSTNYFPSTIYFWFHRSNI